MAICPIANSKGCEQCGIVKVCLLRSVVGNCGQEQPGKQAETTSSGDTGSKPPES